MRAIALSIATLGSLAALASPAAAAGGINCTGDAATAQALTLTVDGEAATGRYVAPSVRPRVAVIMGHGYGYQSDGWVPHMQLAARGSKALALTMDYRGLVNLGDDPTDNWPYLRSRGYPVKKGSEDLVAAGQAVLADCPTIRHVILLGVSMGGNATGMAVALGAKRSDGTPLFDYWIGVEGVYNLLELYEAANIGQAISPFVAQVKEDIETETGGTPQTQPGAYNERTVVERSGDIAASGLKGVILIHAREDGLALYPQAQELSTLLRNESVPTDFYTVGSRAPGDDPDTTLAGYGGVETGQAGHGSEVSEHHVVIDQAFVRMAALIAGEPPPCNRDFQVEGTPRSVTPDPANSTSGCEQGTALNAAAHCRIAAPMLRRVRARRRGRSVRITGVLSAGRCHRGSPRLSIKVRSARHLVRRRLTHGGRFLITLRRAKHARRARVRGWDRGHRTPVRIAQVRRRR